MGRDELYKDCLYTVAVAYMSFFRTSVLECLSYYSAIIHKKMEV